MGWHGLAWVATLEQIQVKDYAEQFTVQQPVYKVGVVFDETSRSIKEWIVEASF